MQMPSRMMRPPLDTLALKATRQTTNLLGSRVENLPFRREAKRWRFGPRTNCFRWRRIWKIRRPDSAMPDRATMGRTTAGASLFPVLAVLKFENGRERLRYVVSTVTPQTLTDDDQKLFTPPDGYIEIEPLPL